MKIFFDMVGCRLNQAEIEQLAGKFRAAGHQIVDTANESELVVINTCAVTAAASSDSRQKVRQLYQAGAKEIILTGCWATLEPDVAKSLPGVTKVFSNIEKMTLPDGYLLLENEVPTAKHHPRIPLPGVHRRTRAFIKVQDGCDNLCTFCITRLARGKSRSLPAFKILEAIHQAQEGGVHEVVLTGVNLGAWGREFAEKATIKDLIRTLLENTSVERIRLSSIEPWDMDDAFLDLWQNRRLCRHFHLPLQSGSVGVLKRMVRNTTPQHYAHLIEHARTKIPGIAITTDLIVGFPGETEDEFEESLEFVKAMHFNGGHVFRFSPREGTAAARMPASVDGKIVRKRADRMRQVLEDSEIKHLQSMKSGKVSVLWESARQRNDRDWQLTGLTDQFMRVKACSPMNRWNEIDQVILQSRQDKVLVGRIVSAG